MKKNKEEEKFDYEMSTKYKYKLSEDLVEIGDYIYDFEIRNLRGYGKETLKVDTEDFAKVINTHYKNTPFEKRRSAKIIATNDPKLIADGVHKY